MKIALINSIGISNRMLLLSIIFQHEVRLPTSAVYSSFRQILEIYRME